MGGGYYANFWKDLSPVFMRVLCVLGCLGGLDKVFWAAEGESSVVDGVERGGG